MGRVKQTQGFSSNVGIEVEDGFISVGDIYVPKLEMYCINAEHDVPFKVLQIYNGDCVMLFLHNQKDTTISPWYLLKYYRKVSPVELQFYEIGNLP